MAATAPCPDVSLFHEMLQDSLAEGQQTELARHLEDCTECRRRYEELAGRVVVLPRAAGEAAGETALHRVIEELEATGPEVTSAANASEQTTVDDQPLDFLDPPDDADSGRLGRLGQYEITELIGRGGMGIVLKGSDTRLNRCVAIKVLAPQLASNATARRRFRRESQAAAAVSHDHVVTIHAVDEINDLPLLVMEYVDGKSLDHRIKSSGPLGLKEILRIALQAASGLAAAHAQGLVHRDIKPSNILLENGVERVKITDFGLARAADDVQLTQTGVVAGTPQYMSPEQARGMPVDHRSDLFSLGSVIYAMCTGRPPFRAETVLDAIRRVCEETPRPIREVNPEVPDWLAEIIDNLLAKEPKDRFQSAAEVAELLGQHLAHLQQPSVVPQPARLSSAAGPRRQTAGSRRHRRWAVAAAVAALLLGGLGITEATGVTKVREFASTMLNIRMREGILVVKIDDPKLKVVVDADGEALTLTGIGEHEITLRPGRHQWQAIRDGTLAHSDWVTITHGGKQVVTAHVLLPAGESTVLGPREPASPHRRPRYFVRLVVGEDSMTFQGRETSWEELPTLLEEVPNRAETVLEFAMPSRELIEQRRSQDSGRAAKLVERFAFEYLSLTGVHPLGTKGSVAQLEPDK